MTSRKLAKLKRQLAQLRNRSVKAKEVERLAKRLGRKKVKRGKEPMWESALPGLFAVAIPHHGGRDLAPGTLRSILNQLEEDVFAWERQLSQNQDDGETNASGDGP
jgi:predicted RNA binding protein YcfA (HicA-like mRNA interferase family)